MGKKKTAAARVIKDDSTKYYKATYQNKDGTIVHEVYVSESYDSAVQYAKGPNSRDRILEGVQEYNELIEALL